MADAEPSPATPASDASYAIEAASSQAANPSAPNTYSSVPGLPPMQDMDVFDNGPGIYAIPFNPLMGSMAGYPQNFLIPITYKIPTREVSGAVVDGREQGGLEARQQQGAQRQVIIQRRFQFAIQLDLTLLIKLAAVVFLFSREGSKQRMVFLVLFASIVYLYRTGVLTPLLRRLQQAVRPAQPRAGPPQPSPENRIPVPHVEGNGLQREGNLAADENPGLNQGAASNQGEPAAVANENHIHVEANAAGEQQQGYLAGIMKEIQMIVVGFIVSLLPGFQHND